MENTTLHTEWAAPLARDIADARASVLITSLSLQPRKRDSAHPMSLLWRAIEFAIEAGAGVTFVMPAPSRSHPATAFNLSAAADLQAIGARVAFAPPANLLHAKTVCIDSQVAWVGSGNWTAAASAHNREAYIRAVCPALADSLSRHWRETFGIQG
jgi:phosphatidylserine/phosphatidylglycerophosphate/cardiolipin synthase-like enzyme